MEKHIIDITGIKFPVEIPEFIKHQNQAYYLGWEACEKAKRIPLAFLRDVLLELDRGDISMSRAAEKLSNYKR